MTHVPATLCFSLSFQPDYSYKLTHGIPISPHTGFGKAVVLGNELGFLAMVALADGDSAPTIMNGATPANILAADVSEAKGLHLVHPAENAYHAIVKVATGDPRVKRMKKTVMQGIEPIHGEPQRIASGTSKTVGGADSLEYLLKMRRDDVVEIYLVNSTRKRLAFTQKGLQLFDVLEPTIDTTPTTTRAEKASKILSPEEKKLNGNWYQARSGSDFRSRDGGRHGLLGIAEETKDLALWGDIYAHLQTRTEELSPGVLIRLSERSPIEEHRKWAEAQLPIVRERINAHKKGLKPETVLHQKVLPEVFRDATPVAVATKPKRVRVLKTAPTKATPVETPTPTMDVPNGPKEKADLRLLFSASNGLRVCHKK